MILLGGDKAARPYKGFLRQVRVWETQVSQEQIRVAMYISDADMNEEDAFIQGPLTQCLIMWPLDDEPASTGKDGPSLTFRSHLSGEVGTAQLTFPGCAECKEHEVPLMDYRPKLYLTLTDKISGDVVLEKRAISVGSNVLDVGARELQSMHVKVELDEAERDLVWLNTIGLRLKGRTQKTLDTATSSQRIELEALQARWSQLFNPGFEESLVQVLKAPEAPPWKRIAAIKVMQGRLGVDRPFSFIMAEEAYKEFVRFNIIQTGYIAFVSEELADRAGALVLDLLQRQGKAGRTGKWFDATLELLSEACEQASSSTGLKTIVQLTTVTWPSEGSAAYLEALSKTVDVLVSLGKYLESGRVPEHNILKTYFGDFSRPLHGLFGELKQGQAPIRFHYNSCRDAKSVATTEESSSSMHQSATSEAVNSDYTDNKVLLKLHSNTVGVEVENKSVAQAQESRDCIKDEPILLKYTDAWKKNRDAVIVLDLGKVCHLTSLSIVPSSHVARGLFWVEAWCTPPPIAGDRFLLKDPTGLAVEVYAFSGQVSFHKESTTIGIRSTFPTVVPRDVLLRTGKWYYEVHLVSASEGVAQIGWADCSFAGNDEEANGVGDDQHSWAFDGNRCQKWNGGSSNWGKRWRTGQTLGCAVDIDKGEISFSINGVWRKPMGVAFQKLKFHGGVFPAVTGEKAFQFTMNLGQRPFKFEPPTKSYKPVWADVQENHKEDKPNLLSEQAHAKQIMLQHRLSSHTQPEPIRVEGSWEARYLRVVYSQISRESSAWMEHLEDSLPQLPLATGSPPTRLDAVDFEAVQQKIQEYQTLAEGEKDLSQPNVKGLSKFREVKHKKPDKPKAKKHKKSYVFTPKKPAVNTGLGVDGQVKRKSGSKLTVARVSLSCTGFTNLVPSDFIGEKGRPKLALGAVLDKIHEGRNLLSQQLETARDNLKVQLERLNTAVITTGASWECLNVDEVGWETALAKMDPGTLHTSCLLVKDALTNVLYAQQQLALLENQSTMVGSSIAINPEEFPETLLAVSSASTKAYGRYSSAALHLTKLLVQKIPDNLTQRRKFIMFLR